MDKYIKIVAYDQDGKQIAVRYQRHFDEDMRASEYGAGIRARELYRDYLRSEGKWFKE